MTVEVEDMHWVLVKSDTFCNASESHINLNYIKGICLREELGRIR